MSQSSFLSVNDKRLHFGWARNIRPARSPLAQRQETDVFELTCQSPGRHSRGSRLRWGEEATVYLMNIRRRNFLKGALAAPWLRPVLNGQVPETSPDDFVTEKYHDRLAPVFADMACKPGRRHRDFTRSGFPGASPQPVESHIVRPGPALEVRRVTFSQQINLGRELSSAIEILTRRACRLSIPPNSRSPESMCNQVARNPVA